MSEDAGSVDALEDIAFPGRHHRELRTPGFRGNDKGRRPSLGVVVWTQAHGAPRQFSRLLFVKNLCDPNAVVGEDLFATRFLNGMVFRIDPPSDHRSLVPPYLIREEKI